MSTLDVHFTYDIIDTDKFEKIYEQPLSVSKEQRYDIITNGIVVYAHTKQGLVGESYGLTPEKLFWIEGEPIEDTNVEDDESIYVYSTTILPQFQGNGYGKILSEEIARHASDRGFVKLLGHATTQRMRKIRENQGAIFNPKNIHNNWYGTSSIAHFYTLFLTQNKDYNCGPMSLAYALEKREISILVDSLELSLNTHEENGTDPKDIENFLISNNISYKPISELCENSIIDIKVEDDGHWITLIEPTVNGWKVYDPLVGIYIDESDIMSKWISPRYGKNKGFQIL